MPDIFILAYEVDSANAGKLNGQFNMVFYTVDAAQEFADKLNPAIFDGQSTRYEIVRYAPVPF